MLALIIDSNPHCHGKGKCAHVDTGNTFLAQSQRVSNPLTYTSLSLTKHIRTQIHFLYSVLITEDQWLIRGEAWSSSDSSKVYNGDVLDGWIIKVVLGLRCGSEGTNKVWFILMFPLQIHSGETVILSFGVDSENLISWSLCLSHYQLSLTAATTSYWVKTVILREMVYWRCVPLRGSMVVPDANTKSMLPLCPLRKSKKLNSKNIHKAAVDMSDTWCW